MYKYLEHEADMGIYAQAKSWPEVFSEGARAVFSLMYGSDFGCQISDVKNIEIQVNADNIEGLFVEWINELLAQKDINSLIFFEFKVDKIDRAGGKYKLVGSAQGIPVSQYKGEVKVEVKAATYSGLKCDRKNNEYFCQCIVDI